MIQIAIASVLKPVKDARAYYKMALSLREKSKYHINIIGFSTKNELPEENISFSPILIGTKTFWNRVCANLNFLRAIQKQHSDIVIVSTWELLPAACLGKIRWNYRLIYDVQENYSLNVQWNQPARSAYFKKWFQIRLIQSIEHYSRKSIDHFILAEACYKTELSKFRPFTYLPNTFSGKETKQSQIRIPSNKPLRFLLTGTLTAVYGVIEGIYWFKRFVQYYPDARLEILGHCTSEIFAQELIDFVYNDEKIALNISQNPVSYPEILSAYHRNDMVLLPYRAIPSIFPKIPSKFYECLALKKPVLYSANTQWEQLMSKYQAGIAIDFQRHSDFPSIIDTIYTTAFYSTSTIPEALWENHAKEFEALIQSMNPLR